MSAQTAGKPLRSPLSWYGGKGHLARHIVPLLPPHDVYLEPFFGGGSVFFAKPPAAIETLNDVDDGVVGFYRVLRDPAAAERLAVLLDLTPYSRVEYETCRRSWQDYADPVERAWAWFVMVRQAFGGGGAPGGPQGGVPGWRTHHTSLGSRGSWGKRTANHDGSAGQRWLTAIAGLPAAHARLQRAQIEHGDWRTVFDAYDQPDCCAYLDPPYVLEQRPGGQRYAHELTLQDHQALTARLLIAQSMVVLSGYRHEAVHAPLEEAGWERRDMVVALSVARNRAGKTRTESVWRNPAALAACRQPGLFSSQEGAEQ